MRAIANGARSAPDEAKGDYAETAPAAFNREISAAAAGPKEPATGAGLTPAVKNRPRGSESSFED